MTVRFMPGVHYVTTLGKYGCCDKIVRNNPSIREISQHWMQCTGSGIHTFTPLEQKEEKCVDPNCLLWSHDPWKGKE